MGTKYRILLLVSVVVLSVIVVGPAVQGAGEATSPDHEVVTGVFSCSEAVGLPGNPGIEASLSFSGTAGLLKSPLLVEGNPIHATEPAGTGELCDTLAGAILGTATRLGCTDGPVRSTSQLIPPGRQEGRSFSFVCQGKRSFEARTIAELIKTLLNETP